MSGEPSPRLAAFDGLRALAAGMVLSYHVALWGGFTRHGPLAGVAAELKAGVAVFFVISGALLYLPYARAIRGGAELPHWRPFARRRFLRMVPAYWVTLTVVALGPFAAGVLTPDVGRFYLLAQIYSPSTIFAGVAGSWSLAVEVSFYALLPVLARGLARAGRDRQRIGTTGVQLALIAAMGVASLCFRTLLAGSVSGSVPGGLVVGATAIPALMDWFAIGMALAVLGADWEADGSCARWLAALAGRPGRCWLVALACYGSGVPFQRGDLFLTLYGPFTHLAVGLAAAFIVLPAISAGATTRALPIFLLTRRPMLWLGTVSYGIYLWHVPVLYAIRGPFTAQSRTIGAAGGLALLLEVAAGAVVLGAASWYLIERPVQRAARAPRLSGRIKAPPVAAR